MSDDDIPHARMMRQQVEAQVTKAREQRLHTIAKLIQTATNDNKLSVQVQTLDPVEVEVLGRRWYGITRGDDDSNRDWINW